MSVVIDRSKTSRLEPSPYRWTVNAMYRAIDAGIFDHPERIELIHGELIEKMSQNPPHAYFVSQLSRLLRRLLEPAYTVREEKPLHIAEDTEPEPDLLVVIGKPEDYSMRHPRPDEVVVLIEVADSSALYDTREKATLYAEAGVATYWVVLVEKKEILVHTKPSGDHYASVERLSSGDSVIYADETTTLKASELFEFLAL